jgi:hypothetical protein
MGKPKVGLMWHGDREARDTVDLKTSRFAKAADAFRSAGFQPIAVVYNDDFLEEVRGQLLILDAVQVWVNPIESGRNRSKLDQLLAEVADAGVLVNTSPKIILKMGTKQVLIDTKDMSWGTDVAFYNSVAQLQSELPTRLQSGPRVLKQLRGHSGGGIWKVELGDTANTVRLRHAQRGHIEEIVTFDDVVNRMRPYFEASGKVIDQAYQSRLPEGITRVYMVETRVGGFGHQSINALYPADSETGADGPPQPGPRLYFPPDQPEFQSLGNLMETKWVGEMQKCLSISTPELPLLWDADFFLGPKDEDGNDTYVLCEINVSCVSPYPEWANPLIAETLLRRIKEVKTKTN